MEQRIYLDSAATTPVDARVLKAMQPYFSHEFGNPGSLHSFGQKAMGAVDLARETVAKALEVDFREVIFTGSATEANNLALRGVVKRAMSDDRRAGEKILRLTARKQATGSSAQDDAERRPRIIVSAIEHESVLETARDLERAGVDVVYLPVNKKGIVSLDALKSALTPETVLVSVMYVNNETGAVQPIAEIGQLIADLKRRTKDDGRRTLYPLLHTDAAQAFQFFSCKPRELGVDLMTLSGHKIYGPKGVGALFVRGAESSKLAARFSPLASVTSGGGQEYGMRSGTENVPAIVGFAKAVELAGKERADNLKKASALRKIFQGSKSFSFNLENSAPHILNIWLKGKKTEDVLTKLDLSGIAVSSGSACRSRSFEPSYVLKAMGLPDKRIAESIRISFSKFTNAAEARAALKALKEIIAAR